jgi:hypothetical protein
MALPTLSPPSQTSAVVLPSTGSYTDAGTASNYPYGLYVSETKADGTSSELYDANFVTGAVEQVTFTYRKLGGDVLDIELDPKNIFAAYEEAVLEYSYIVNVHQAKNILHSVMGATTGTFDSDGQRTDSLSGSNVELKYPRFKIGYAKRIGDSHMLESGLGGSTTIYSSSLTTETEQQDYNLQALIYTASLDTNNNFYNKVGNKKVAIRRVYFKTPHSMWRFYGYFGGLNTVGNLSTYGMYADDSTYEIVPPWQNKLQAMAYEDSIYTRNSHYSYEINNNNLRIFPIPLTVSPKKIWYEFTIEEDPWDERSDVKDGEAGINNMNTIPFANILYKNINSIGKQWIRRFALALVKETLGQIRSKFGNVPIPGSTVTLNGTSLLTDARAEQKELREELQKILDELTYEKLTEIQKNMNKNVQDTMNSYPYFIYQG